MSVLMAASWTFVHLQLPQQPEEKEEKVEEVEEVEEVEDGKSPDDDRAEDRLPDD